MSATSHDEPGRQVDPWRFTCGFLRKVLSSRIPEKPSYDPIPWAPVTKPLAESRVALLSVCSRSARISLRSGTDSTASLPCADTVVAGTKASRRAVSRKPAPPIACTA